MLAIVDYGLGNLRSICAALERLEVEYACTADPEIITRAHGLILPGVGAFQDGMNNLRALGLVELLNDLVLTRKRPVLGICLGFQLMAREGWEFGRAAGLGWLNGSVVPLEQTDEAVRIPHMGWNDCVRTRESPLFAGIPADALFYFTHSFHMRCDENASVLAVSDHGARFVAAVEKANIFGTQFHPEKSQWNGLSLLRNFATTIAIPSPC